MASTPDSDRSYFTRCSQVDCMRSMSKTGNFMAAPSSLASALLRVRAESLELLLGELEHVRAFERTDPAGHLDSVDDVGVPEQHRQGDEHRVGGRLLKGERARLVADRFAEVGLDRSELERSRAELVRGRDRRALVGGRHEDGVDRTADEGIAVLDERSDVAHSEPLLEIGLRGAET